MGPSDLQIQVWQRKLACVIEPTLALAVPAGPALALGLARAFEAWLTRSFWQVLDASDLLARPPSAGANRDRIEPDARALASWIEMRDCTDAGSWTLRWLGDNMAESQLREVAQIDLIERYESLQGALLARLEAAPSCPSSGALGGCWNAGLDCSSAAADALALSACLDGAMVLCAGSDGAVPGVVHVLDRATIPATAFNGDDGSSLLAAERVLVRQSLAAAGLAPLLQTFPRLAAVHVLAPDDAGSEGANPWTGAQAWWYWL
jgi:hypothetical protein